MYLCIYCAPYQGRSGGMLQRVNESKQFLAASVASEGLRLLHFCGL
jgi:hypothetical protein